MILDAIGFILPFSALIPVSQDLVVETQLCLV